MPKFRARQRRSAGILTPQFLALSAGPQRRGSQNGPFSPVHFVELMNELPVQSPVEFAQPVPNVLQIKDGFFH
jgi:hypothetical protein